MASLIAAVTHDLDHPGVNQPFLVATSNHLAALYQVSRLIRKVNSREAQGVPSKQLLLIAEHVGSGESSLEVSDRVPLGERRFGSTSGQRETGTATTHQLAYSGNGHYATAGVSCPIQGEPSKIA